jgi:hypothetical protein
MGLSDILGATSVIFNFFFSSAFVHGIKGRT